LKNPLIPDKKRGSKDAECFERGKSMKKSVALIILALVIWVLVFPGSPISQEKLPGWEVYFSPNGGCTEAIIKELNKAKTTILVQAYHFSSEPIAKALLDAHKKGGKVEVILDKSQKAEKYSAADFFANSGIPTKIDSAHNTAHNKIIIIDDETVITGSFNFTKNAEEKNAENLLVIRDKKLAERYVKNWQEHEKHSETYIGKAESKQIRVAPHRESSPLQSKLDEYYNTIWEKIKAQWVISGNLQKELIGLETVIVLKIDRSGKVKEMRYEKRSGNPQYDQTAWQAIKKAEPFPPIPKEFDSDIFEIGIRFYPD
jgi:TonB family protein